MERCVKPQHQAEPEPDLRLGSSLRWLGLARALGSFATLSLTLVFLSSHRHPPSIPSSAAGALIFVHGVLGADATTCPCTVTADGLLSNRPSALLF
jgi:hypothetical protein